MVIPVEQAKAQLDALIDRSTAGEEVVITRNGRPVARMVAVDAGSANGAGESPNGPRPAAGAPAQRLGWGKDIITHIAPDFDEPLEDFREYTE